MFSFIIKPVITEKATAAQARGKYQFFVRKEAKKIDIKSAFKHLYGVDVAKVNVMRTAEKFRMTRARRPAIKKPEFKKVIITTKGQKTIDINKPKLKL